MLPESRSELCLSSPSVNVQGSVVSWCSDSRTSASYKCLYMKQPLAKWSFITFYTVTSCFLVCNIWSLSQFYGAVSLYNCFLCGFTSHSCHISQRSKATALKCSPSEDFLLVYRDWSFQTSCCCSNGERRQRALHHWGSSLRYWTPNRAEERQARAGVRG